MKQNAKSRPRSRRTRRNSVSRARNRSDEQVTELLKLCLQKVCQLQEDLKRTEDETDPEAAGYAACAMETVRFLAEEGLPDDHPIMKTLTEKLFGDENKPNE